MSTIVKVRRGPLASIPTAEAGEFITTSDTHQAFFGDGAVNYELEKIAQKGAASGYAPLDASAKINAQYLAQDIAATAAPTFAGLTIGTYPTTWVVGLTGANLLTANQSDAETDTAGMSSNWATFSRTTTGGEFYAGTAGFKVVATSVNTMNIYTSTKISGLIAGNYYCFSVYAKASTSAKTWRLLIDWYDAADAYLSASGSTIVAASTSFTRLSLIAIAPATATKCIVKISLITPTIGDILYVDNLMFERASVNNIANIVGTLGLNGVPIGAIESVTHTPLATDYNLTGVETAFITQNITLSAQRYCLFLFNGNYMGTTSPSNLVLNLYDGATFLEQRIVSSSVWLDTTITLIAFRQLASGAHTIYVKVSGDNGCFRGHAGDYYTHLTTVAFAF